MKGNLKLLPMFSFTNPINLIYHSAPTVKEAAEAMTKLVKATSASLEAMTKLGVGQRRAERRLVELAKLSKLNNEGCSV